MTKVENLKVVTKKREEVVFHASANVSEVKHTNFVCFEVKHTKNINIEIVDQKKNIDFTRSSASLLLHRSIAKLNASLGSFFASYKKNTLLISLGY